ncbi:hypothetical protein EBU95_05425 [bacterium]|nr:hypothetical protein [bacterium]
MARIKKPELIDMLVETARQSPLQFRHSACVLHGRRVFSFGYNRYYETIGSTTRNSVHAEVSAMANSKDSVKGKDIFVIRIGAKDDLRNSRPCEACVAKLKSKGIRRVFYSNEQGGLSYEYVCAM